MHINTGILLVLLTILLRSAYAQEDAAKAELATFLEAARQYEIRTVNDQSPLKLHEPSLLNFTNPERNQERGSVFV